DINCGEILDGTVSVQQMYQKIFELFLRTASGEASKSELLGLGDYEFVPWQIGIKSRGGFGPSFRYKIHSF
ncbi:MAG: UxaA family hydrolase, partial [Polaromonas sp.]|nr:UxaA family hydrolase [Polaromonas sp.]